MKTDALDLDHAQLIHTLNAQYGVAIASLRFVPKGEEAYAYIAQTEAGAQFFVRAQLHAPAMVLEQAYTITHALHDRHGLRQIVAPLATQRKTYTIQSGAYSVALFPLIDGRTLYEQGATGDDLRGAATLLAAVHQTPTNVAAFPLHKEHFDNPFHTPILRALAVAAAPPAHATAYQQHVCRLLMAERADILTTLDHMQRLQVQAQTLPIHRIITHGDPNLDNFLQDEHQTLHLTDWGEVALGPPERDLSSFTGDRFAVFLRHYASLVPDLTLHPELFAFYFYRWTLQEIADYATRILFHHKGPTGDEHAWTELQPYLPIRHADIAKRVHDVQDVIEHALG